MKIGVFASRSRRIARFFIMLDLLAAATLLGACKGSSGAIDYTYWRDQFGDPDTGACCTNAERGGNR